MIYNLNGKVEGKYKVEVVSPDGSISYPLGKDWHKNIVLNSGLDMIFNGAAPANATTDFGFTAMMAYARVGTGTSTPVATQSTLDAQTQSCGSYNSTAGNNKVTFNTGTGAATFQRVFEFTPVGSNITLNEVGLSNSPTSTDPLFSRALFSSPVALLGGQNLRLTYAVTVTIPALVTPVSVSVSSNGFNGAGNLYAVGAFSGVFGDINADGTPSGGTDGSIPSILRGKSLAYRGYLTTNASAPSVNTNLTKSFAGTSANDSRSSNPTGSYTTGNYYLDSTVVWPLGTPANDVSNVNSIAFDNVNGSTVSQGVLWVFTNQPQSKISSYTLTTVLRITWATS